MSNNETCGRGNPTPKALEQKIRPFMVALVMSSYSLESRTGAKIILLSVVAETAAVLFLSHTEVHTYCDKSLAEAQRPPAAVLPLVL